MDGANLSADEYFLSDLNDSRVTSMMSPNGTNCSTVPSQMIEDTKYIDKALKPIIYAFGFPGNILSFIIWIRPRMRHSSGIYLAVLAIVQFIYLVLDLLYELETSLEVQTIVYPVICESFSVIFLTVQYLAPLLVLAFTVERYISICHPFKRGKYCTTRRAKIVSLSLVFISLAICAIQGYFWSYQSGGCGIRQEVLLGGNNSLWNIWSWTTELLFFLVVPLSVLAFNILVIKEARKKRMSEYEHSQIHGRTQKTSSTTVMLLAVSFYLIFTTLPVTVVYVSVLNFDIGPDCGIQDENPIWRRYYIYHLVRAVIEGLGVTHFAMNFYIYLITGKLFRKELKLMCMDVINKHTN